MILLSPVFVHRGPGVLCTANENTTTTTTNSPCLRGDARAFACAPVLIAKRVARSSRVPSRFRFHLLFGRRRDAPPPRPPNGSASRVRRVIRTRTPRDRVPSRDRTRFRLFFCFVNFFVNYNICRRFCSC